MQRSTDRILTTHVGALQRPPELSKALAEQGEQDPGVLGQLTVTFGLTGDFAANPGLDVLAKGIEDGIAELVAAASEH